MRIVGYLRVSTQDQGTEKNKGDILAWANSKGLGPVQWVEEKISGVKDWRKRELGKLVESLEAGDWLVTPEFSRLARSTLQILEVLKVLKEKDVNVYIIKGSQVVNGTIENKIFVTLMGLFAEIERDLISARTIEGLKAARAQGRVGGRPKGPGKSKLDEFRPEIEALLANGSTQAWIARRFGVQPLTLAKWLGRHGIKPRAGILLKEGNHDHAR
jgi:DNA invertase Pin-like site-specific DNA recombinase